MSAVPAAARRPSPSAAAVPVEAGQQHEQQIVWPPQHHFHPPQCAAAARPTRAALQPRAGNRDCKPGPPGRNHLAPDGQSYITGAVAACAGGHAADKAAGRCSGDCRTAGGHRPRGLALAAARASQGLRCALPAGELWRGNQSLLRRCDGRPGVIPRLNSRPPATGSLMLRHSPGSLMLRHRRPPPHILSFTNAVQTGGMC